MSGEYGQGPCGGNGKGSLAHQGGDSSGNGLVLALPGGTGAGKKLQKQNGQGGAKHKGQESLHGGAIAGESSKWASLFMWGNAVGRRVAGMGGPSGGSLYEEPGQEYGEEPNAGFAGEEVVHGLAGGKVGIIDQDSGEAR